MLNTELIALQQDETKADVSAPSLETQKPENKTIFIHSI